MLCKNLKQPTQTYIDVCYYGIVKNQLPELCARWLILFLLIFSRKEGVAGWQS